MRDTNQIKIPDVEPESFRLMLRYLYMDEICIESDTVMSILYLAKKYAIYALERECIEFLRENLRPENAFMILQQARLFDEPQLIEQCLDKIDTNSIEAFSSESFLDTDKDTLKLILMRDTLGIREFRLYNFLVEWAKNKHIKSSSEPLTREKLQIILGDTVSLIRFPLMTREEFAMIMYDQSTRLIDDTSIIDLFINFSLNGKTSSHNNIDSTQIPKECTGENCLICFVSSKSTGQTSANNSSAATTTSTSSTHSVNDHSSLLSSNIFLSLQSKYNYKPRCSLVGKEQSVNRFRGVENRWGYSGTFDRVRFTVSTRIFVSGFGLYGSVYEKCEYQVYIQLYHHTTNNIIGNNTTTFTSDGTFKYFFFTIFELK
jgi:hypothetical protein